MSIVNILLFKLPNGEPNQYGYNWKSQYINEWNVV